MIETQFQEIQDQFMNKNYKHFEDTDENKLIYTTIHREYVIFFKIKLKLTTYGDLNIK